jgi:hypothetical protein
MKPLQAAPLTEEDYEIFLERWSQSDNGAQFRACRDADRRDAGLMLAAQEKRLGHWGQIVRYAQVEPDRYRYTSFGGAMLGSMAIDPTTWRDITYFA